MKKILFVFLFCIPFLSYAGENLWGPKIKLKTVNDIGQYGICYIGVDENATDGWDKDVKFNFDGEELVEYEFLPPAPPSSIYCVMIKDSLLPYDSESYVDFRGIPYYTDTFIHKYRMNVTWGKYSQNITIHWGQLPDGIDSAKFSCYEWMDGIEPIDMKSVEEVNITNDAFRRFDFTIWYNKKQSGIEYNNSITSKLVNDFLLVDETKYIYCSIINVCGADVFNTEIKSNYIDLRNLPTGVYLVRLLDMHGNIDILKIIKS